MSSARPRLRQTGWSVAARAAAAVLALAAALLVAPPAAASSSFTQLGSQPTRVAGGVNDQVAEYASVTPDGTQVAFVSAAELTPSVTNGGAHTFVFDVASGTYEQIDVVPNGRSSETYRDTQYDGVVPKISADGRYVAFSSGAVDLDPNYEDLDNFNGDNFLYLRDRQTQTTTLVSITRDGETFDIGQFSRNDIDISDDGSRVAYTADVNPHGFCGSPAALAVYVYDVASAEHILVSADGDGCIPEANSDSPSLADGAIVWSTMADGMAGLPGSGNTDIWYADFATATYEVLTGQADADSDDPSISADGRYVAFETETGVYDPADTNFRSDIYLRDRTAGTTTLMSTTGAGGVSDGNSTKPELSSNASYVLFNAEAELTGPMTPSEAGDQDGVYRVATQSGAVVRADLAADGTLPTRGFQSIAQDVADEGSVVYSTTNETIDGERGLFHVAGTGGTPPPTNPAPTGDAAGAIATAITTSQARFPDAGGTGGLHGGPADYGVLATVESFADALSGAVLTQQGPLLLTGSEQLEATTLAEFDRVLGGSGTIYVLGGVNALSEAVTNALTAGGYTVQRLEGASRFETSTAIAAEARSLLGQTGEIAVARAFGPEGNPTAAWADSVTGGGYAAESGTPIILTPTESVHPALQAFLDSDQPGTVHLLGGTAALAESLDDIPGARRTAGLTRFDTARQIALQLWEQPEDGARAYIILDATTEFGWAFGLPAAGATADANAPFQAVGSTTPPETREAVAGCGDQVTLARVGPVAQEVFDDLDAQDTAPC